MAEEHRQRLGRGLAALLGTEEGEAALTASGRLRRVPVEKLRPNPRNPRRAFQESELTELAESIKARGVLQPLIARDLGGQYEIIAGERRWRASQRAGLHDVPVIFVDADDRLALEIAIVENVQRADLNPVEEAQGYAKLLEEHGYGQANLASMIGKSRSHVANTLRLLKLPESVLVLLSEGKISAGHARALLALDDPDSVAKKIAREGLSVRDVERLAAPKPPTKKARPDIDADANVKALSKVLTEQTGLNILISKRGETGKITIEFKSLEQFDYVFSRMNEW